MKFDDTLRKIKKIHNTLTSTDNDITFIFMGGSAGQSNWKIKIGNRELNSNDHIAAADDLLKKLAEELAAKVSLAEAQLAAYHKTLNEISKN